MAAKDHLQAAEGLRHAIIEPFQKMVDALKEAAECEAVIAGNREALERSKTELARMQADVAAAKTHLEHIKNDLIPQVQAKVRAAEDEHAKQVAAQHATMEQLRQVHATEMVNFNRQKTELEASIRTLQNTYRQTHESLEAQHQQAVATRASELATLDKSIKVLQDKKAEFLKSLGA